jgi:hypothetical protein
MVALSSYLSTTQSLIQSPNAPIPLVTTALLTQFVNLARQQVAIDAECVRGSGSVDIPPGTTNISITSIGGLPSGAEQAIVVRNALVGDTRVDIRPWDWFAQYYLNGIPPNQVPPTPVMSHQGQGAFSTLFFSTPNGGTLNLDLVLLPIDLASDNDPDAVPYPWTDAVPFYAAWYAYMSSQRQADAQLMLGRYGELVRRGRTTVTSTNLPENDPGGVGAMMATTKTSLGGAPPQMAAGRGGG